MKPSEPNFRRRASSAFTLIELIGVLAIMAILASVLVPNVLKSIDRAAVAAEAQTLSNLGDATKLFLSQNGYLPGKGTGAKAQLWNVDISLYTDLRSDDVLTNPRLIKRAYLIDIWESPYPRAMIVSNMRSIAGNLPGSVNSAQFEDIWTNGAAAAIFGGRWSGDAQDQLIIERINLRALNFVVHVTLNNDGSAPCRYRLIGSASTPVPDGASPVPMTSQQTLELMDGNDVVQIRYVPSGTTAKIAFGFKDTKWGYIP